MLRVLYPVAICMIFVAFNVHLSRRESGNKSIIVYGIFRSYDMKRDGLTAVYLFGFLIATTTMGVICYKKKLYRAIKVYLVANSVVLLIVYSLIHFHNLAEALSIPLSLPTAVFGAIQFGCLGVLSLHWKSSRKLHQFYLVMLAALTALFLVRNLPDWSVWTALVAVCIWDILAVLTPCGPLKMLVETASRRGDDNFPAVLYNSGTNADSNTPDTVRSNSTMLTEFPYSSSSRLQSDSLLTTPVVRRRKREVREVEGTIRLGLGDFVFYSLMLGNAVQTSPLTTVVACFISNLVGLTITLPVVTLSQTALPALPFPLLISAFFYFSSHVALTPFTDLCTSKLIMF